MVGVYYIQQLGKSNKDHIGQISTIKVKENTMKKLEGKVSEKELEEYFWKVNSDRKYSVDDFYEYLKFLEEEERSFFDYVEEDDPNYKILTDLQLRLLQFIDGTMDATVVNKKQKGLIMSNQIVDEEVDMVTFEPMDNSPSFYLDEPYLWSHNEQQCSKEYLDSLTNMYKNIVQTYEGSSSHLLGRCTKSYNHFLYLESHPPNRIHKFLSDRLTFGHEEVDGYFNLHITGPYYLMNMIYSIRTTYNRRRIKIVK
jgi:hypothetical protein